MKMRKVISAFLVLICIISTLGLCTIGASAAEGAKTVYATTSTSIKQGSYEYLYVYLDDLTDLSALNISVYYDSEDVTVKSVYNQVPSVVNDLAMGDGQVNASYIFDGKGSAEKTNLFYIYYQVNSTAEVGETYFDIVVNEAFDSALESMDFTGSRCAFEIAEQTVSKSCTISSTSNASTSVGEEFELSYHLSTYQIASGSMNIQYDPELFEIVTVVNGGFLEGKITDVNTALDGTVSISFVGTTYQFKCDVVTVRFKTLKNVTETSDIKLVVTDLYDKELNLYSCSGYTTKASITFDESYTEDAPSMSISSSYNAETGKVTATIKLEKDSNLGAGDFALKFDTRYLTYISAEKGFSPTFFNINDKDAADGILKFSIISLSDITDEQVILTVVFEAKHYCQDKISDFEISGSGLTDSLVNTIPLNFVDSSIIIPLKHTAATAVVENRVEPTCTVNGSYDSVVYCSVCSIELSREAKTIDKIGHDHSTEWTVDVEPTCTTTGSKSHHCSRCSDKANVTEISPNGHSAGSVVLENNVAPDCTNKGSYDNVVYCTVCGDELSRENITVDELGHTEVIDEAVTATCTATGLTEGKHCSVCYAVLVAQEVVEKLGHNYGEWHEMKAPTCTATGEEERKCSICNNKETRTVDVLGHSAGTTVVENKIEATCTADGSYDSVVYCSHCNNELSREIKITEKLGHSYHNACDEICGNCGEKRSVSGHIDVNTDNCCDECGVEMPKQSGCGSSLDDKVFWLLLVFVSVILLRKRRVKNT